MTRVFCLESLLKGIRHETREETNAKSRMMKRVFHHHKNTQKQARKKQTGRKKGKQISFIPY
jgi:hypothetical protein